MACNWKRTIPRICALALIACVLANGAAQCEEWNKDIRALYQARDKNQLQPCLQKATEMLAEHGKDAQKAQEIYSVMVVANRRHQKWDDAIAVYESQRKAFPDNSEIQRACLVGAADIQREAQRWEKAIEAYRNVITQFAADGSTCAYARLQIGDLYKNNLKKLKEALAEYEEVEKCNPKNKRYVAQALASTGDCRLALGEFVPAYTAYRRLLDNFTAGEDPGFLLNVKASASKAILASKDWKEAAGFFSKFEAIETDEKFRAQLGFNHAEALRATGDKAAARANYCRVQSQYPSEPSFLYDCQSRIVELWVEEGKFPEALAASRLLFDLAWDEERIVQACSAIAARMKAIDGHLTRANAFLKFQKFGPQGEDGKSPQPNPLQEVPYPAEPERLAMLKSGLERTGDSALGARQRALLWILMAQPKEALKEFRMQFARSNEDLIQRAAQDWITIGVKAARGHATGLGPYYDWINYGPAGKDGKGQATNPFETLP